MARKNEIFTSNHQASKTDAVPQGVMRQDVMKEFGWEVPVDLAPLPSQGLVYTPGSSLHGKEAISIRAMTAREEDILMSSAYSKQGTTITELLKSCVIDKTFDPADLLVGDRLSVLVAIRITGYGSDYRASVTCPKCGTAHEQNFDLAGLGLKHITAEPVSPGTNEFAYKLPISKKNVTFKFLTGKDDEELNAISAKRKKIFGELADAPVTLKLSHQILSIDGVTDKNKISTFVSNMPAGDSRALRKFIDDNEPTLDMTSSVTCSSCGASSEVALPIGVNFFWPRD